MTALVITLILGMVFGHFGRMLSWIGGGFLVFFTLFIALFVGGVSLSALVIAFWCIISYNIGLMLILLLPASKKPLFR